MKGDGECGWWHRCMLVGRRAYIWDGTVKEVQPMGANFGIRLPLSERIRDKQGRYMAYAGRSPLC